MPYIETPELIEHFIGRVVTVQTYGHRRFIGKVEGTLGDFLLLKNATTFDDYEGGRWQDAILTAEIEDDCETGAAEALIRLHHIESIISEGDVLYPQLAKKQAVELDAATISAAPPDSPIRIGDPLAIRFHPNLASLLSDGVSQNASVTSRIGRLRAELACKMGFEFPSVRVYSDVDLDPGEYQFLIHGVRACSGVLQPDKLLALLPSDQATPFTEPIFQEPAFHLFAQWIDPKQLTLANKANLTVVDPCSVLVTHFNQLVTRQRQQLLSYQMVEDSLLRLRFESPALVNDHFGTPESKTILLDYLRELLNDGVWIGNFLHIAEAASTVSQRGQPFLQSYLSLRNQLAEQIIQPAVSNSGKVDFVCFDPSWESNLLKADWVEPLDFETRIESILIEVSESRRKGNESTNPQTAFVLMAPFKLRPILQRIARRQLGQWVMAYGEELRVASQVVLLRIISAIDFSDHSPSTCSSSTSQSSV